MLVAVPQCADCIRTHSREGQLEPAEHSHSFVLVTDSKHTHIAMQPYCKCDMCESLLILSESKKTKLGYGLPCLQVLYEDDELAAVHKPW